MVSEDNTVVTCGDLIRTWRKRRKLSRHTLAHAVGISPSTVSNWESERFLPRLPELLSTLESLGVPPEVRQEAISRLNRPRAIQWLHTEASEDVLLRMLGLPPSPHDLLRCLRLRAEKTIEETALLIGVSSRTLLRWENGDTWPDTAHLHTLCYTLNALPEEVAALSRRSFSTLPFQKNLTDATTVEEVEIAFRAHAESSFPPEKMALSELANLSLIASLWPHARHSEAARELIFSIYAEQGSNHALCHRPVAAQFFLGRALAYLDSTKQIPRRAGLAIAREAYIQKTPEASLRILRSYLPRIEEPGQRSWMLMLISRYLCQGREYEESDVVSKQSLEAAERAEPIELTLRRCDRVELLAEIGRPEEAYPLLLPVESSHEPSLPMLWAKTAAASGDQGRAYSFYQLANRLAISRAQEHANFVPYLQRQLQMTQTFIERRSPGRIAAYS